MELSKRVSTWSVQDVLEWVQDQHPGHMSTLQRAFIKHDISGKLWCVRERHYYSDATIKPARARAPSRPCAAQTEGSPPGASRLGHRGAAAGDFAGPPTPPSSGRNQRAQGPPLWWGGPSFPSWLSNVPHSSESQKPHLLWLTSPFKQTPSCSLTIVLFSSALQSVFLSNRK